MKRNFQTFQGHSTSHNAYGKWRSKGFPHNKVVNSDPNVKSLPIFSAKQKFLSELNSCCTCILIGETGSGKSTQVPQYIYNSTTRGCKVSITQPRRVAAIALAKRVAHEMNVGVGSVVGYKVRFEDVSNTEKTKILFQTDGMLLREAMIDPALTCYSHIILDEAHERTVNTDILFGIVKTAQKLRNNDTENRLKIIVMSATLDAHLFSTYFDNAPILYVEGRQHSVYVHHMKKLEKKNVPAKNISQNEDYSTKILSTIHQIHHTAPVGHHILVFMTGQDEIENMVRRVQKMNPTANGSNEKYASFDSNSPANRNYTLKAISLYAAKSGNVDQDLVFKNHDDKTFRKVVVATNIAETSLTIPGVRYVIDCCKVKTKVYLPEAKIDVLRVVNISKAQAKQRCGRAGRISEGHCYRMVTKDVFDKFDETMPAEILRTNLTSVALQMLSILGESDISTFDFVESPPLESVKDAILSLIQMGAVKPVDGPSCDKVVLTELGRRLTIFPLDPKLTKCILLAESLGCSEEIVSIVSILTSDSIILSSSSNHVALQSATSFRNNKFASSTGDHVTYLNIFRAFRKVDASQQYDFCSRYALNYSHLKFASSVRKQLLQLCIKNSIRIISSFNMSSDEESLTSVIRKCLVQVFHLDIARRTVTGHYETLVGLNKTEIHPSSVLYKSKPALIMYSSVMATQNVFLRDVSVVSSEWIKHSNPELYRINFDG